MGAQSVNTATEAFLRILKNPNTHVYDVRLADDISAWPYHLPRSERIDHTSLSGRPGPAIVVCHKGLKLSIGGAALLRADGQEAHHLDGGSVAWQERDLPAIPDKALSKSGIYTCIDDKDAFILDWLVTRLLTPRSRTLIVPLEQADDVADRFDAPLLRFRTAFDHFGLTGPLFERFALALQDTRRYLDTASKQQIMAFLDTLLIHAALKGSLS